MPKAAPSKTLIYHIVNLNKYICKAEKYYINAEEFHQNLKRSRLTNYVSYKFENLRAFT